MVEVTFKEEDFRDSCFTDITSRIINDARLRNAPENEVEIAYVCFAFGVLSGLYRSDSIGFNSALAEAENAFIENRDTE